ncbi:nucleotidyltransferase domain-containing protein [Thermococcus argininiproducens]|uniref:Nucleotidyltransferase domain-containing protein n=1 Tax=Thermococcus argininiproducens TaxID=2866384 RepID=A0A9E7MCZ4_9EURY|nr:nucleotidyltransferase domain-containing protein [Thermococcus argininiproducens]
MPNQSLRKSEVLNCIRSRIEKDKRLKGEIYSLIIYGSFVRGDFVKEVSDVDFFVVIRDNEDILTDLRSILEECIKSLNPVEVDLAWEFLGNLHDPLNKGVPFKFLTIYQKDFLENHIVVYGDEIAQLLPKYRFEELIEWRAKRLLKLAERHNENLKMLHITAGEAVRLLALINGAESLKKGDVLKILQSLGDKEALSIYEAYINGRSMPFSGPFLKGFIISRCEKMLKTIRASNKRFKIL